MHTLKPLLRVAVRLHKSWLASSGGNDRAERDGLDRLAYGHETLTCTRRLLDKARLHGLPAVASQMHEQLHGQLIALQETLSRTLACLKSPAGAIPSLASLLTELLHLRAEFGEVEIDWPKRALGVTTEPITLDEVDLGPFTIWLCWERLADQGDARCFTIEAREPNPAASDERVTHPHVRSDKLCAGDATAPLRKALEQGRLVDAFCLVRSVLRHYNAQSPYVPLEDWSGSRCHDCGYTMSEDASWCCPTCDHEFCDDCTRNCTACDSPRCLDCLDACVVCDAQCCRHCLQPLAHSGQPCCAGCRVACAACGNEVTTDEVDTATDLCPACLASQPPFTDDANANEVASDPNPLTHPLASEEPHATPLVVNAPAAG